MTNNSIVRSMTGQGHATEQGELGSVTVEVRTINNRGFKCAPRVSESLASMETKIEALARSLIHRGTVHLSVNLRRSGTDGLPTINQDVLGAYLKQMRATIDASDALHPSIDLSNLLALPGVLEASRDDLRDDDSLWSFIEGTIVRAIDNLNEMRWAEGARMAETLSAECRGVEDRLSEIASLAPRAVDVYRTRLEGKIQRVLQEQELEVPPTDLLREVQIFADRVDISEEITRLGSHLKMFAGVLAAAQDTEVEPKGRKLDFIIQEMFRETNTIGSKAADAEVSAHVVEIKCAIERMRELVQNLE